MNRTLKQLLRYLLFIPLLSACGVESDPDAEPYQSVELDRSAVDQVHGDVTPRVQGAVQVIRANDAPDDTPLTSPVDPLALILIDRTGSMTVTRPSTHNTRCIDAVNQAEEQLNELSDAGVNSFAVWTFAGSSVVQRVSYVSKMTAFEVIDSLRTESCIDSTPLAYAMCAAAQNLSQNRGSSANVAYLAVSTDGGENNSAGSPLLTIGNTNCSGPTGDVSTAGTWRNNVENYIKNTIGNIKVDDTYWVTPALATPVRGAGLNAVAACASEEQCDDTFFSSLSNVTGGNFRRAKDNSTAYPCVNSSACQVPDSTNIGNRFSFTAVNTNGGTVNTGNYSVYLLAGETITAGTCGVAGSSGSGDTILRLFNPSGAQVALNDDSCGILSNLVFTAATTGTYLFKAGCFSINSCSGTVAFTIRGSFTYNTSNTNNAIINTTNHDVYLRPAQNIAVGTCGVTGASGVGDTFLRLFNASSSNVALNDNSCTLLSNLSYNVPAGAGGMHQIHAGCSSTGSCSGTVAYLITQLPGIN